MGTSSRKNTLSRMHKRARSHATLMLTFTVAVLLAGTAQAESSRYSDSTSEVTIHSSSSGGPSYHSIRYEQRVEGSPDGGVMHVDIETNRNGIQDRDSYTRFLEPGEVTRLMAPTPFGALPPVPPMIAAQDDMQSGTYRKDEVLTEAATTSEEETRRGWLMEILERLRGALGALSSYLGSA